MFKILNDKTICLTRGDVANIVFAPKLGGEDVEFTPYVFNEGDVVRFTVTNKNDYTSVIIMKDVIAEAGADKVVIRLTSDDTRIGDPINKPTDYWYEIEINPDTAPQTPIGFDTDGPKLFRLFPEGGAKR